MSENLSISDSISLFNLRLIANPLSKKPVSIAQYPRTHGFYDLPGRGKSGTPIFAQVPLSFSHGNRQPDKFLEENPRTWGFEGSSELTAFGKRQAYGLGRELRVFADRLVDTNYNRSQVKYYSSSASRCQMTLQVALAGFHEPVDWADWDQSRHDFWSPIPYTIDDHLLRMYAAEDCPNSDKVWDPISNDHLPELVEKKRETPILRGYCQQNTGWNMSNLGYMADLADNLIEIDLYGAEYPSWIEKPTLAGYTSDRLKKEILGFAEIHQIACAEYAPCGNLMAGVWLQNILDTIKDKQAGKGPVMIGYASHTEITLSVMRLMGINKDELTTSAGFVLEFRTHPFPSVRILNHDPNPIDQHVIYRSKYLDRLAEIEDKDGFIPLKDFIDYTSSKAISNWKSVCGASSESCDLVQRDQREGSSARGVSSLFLLLVAIFMHF